jgi:hypothetical protein
VNLIVALVATVIIVSGVLLLTLFIGTVFWLRELRRRGIALVSPTSEQRIREQLQRTTLGLFLLYLFPLALWWFNGPIFLWNWLVRGNQQATMSNPRGRR